MKGKGFSYPQKGYDISIRDYYTCQSTYVIYIIKCLCGLLYVGETTQKVKDRIARHKYSIRDKLEKLPLSRHFVDKGHTVSQLRFIVFDGVPKK